MSFACKFCDKIYATYAGLYSHIRHHDPDYIPKFSCSICEYKHDNIYHLKSHQNAHLKKNEQAEIITNVRKLYRKDSYYATLYKEKSDTFNCPICDKAYLYRQSLQVHIKTHNPNREYRFNCCFCDLKTDHKGHFLRHINSNNCC